VVRSHFPSTLLTVDCSRWRPTIHRRLSALVASSFANYFLGSRWVTPDSLLATTTLSRVLLLSPTADYCLRRLAHRLSDLPGWLSRLTACDDDYDYDSSLRNSCLKVGEGERYSRHLPQLFIYALKRVGYWGNVCCPFTMYSSGFILGIANRYHAYNIVSLRRCVAVTVYPAVG
jgi:hypothetical protein